MAELARYFTVNEDYGGSSPPATAFGGNVSEQKSGSNGKGDKRRPTSIPKKEFEENWRRIFNKPEEPTPKKDKQDV